MMCTFTIYKHDTGLNILGKFAVEIKFGSSTVVKKVIVVIFAFLGWCC